MGYYVNVHAKAGCALQINELWAQAGYTDDLIWTKARIQREIDHIHSSPACEHLRYISNVAAWNKAFAIHAEDRGQIFIGSIGFDRTEEPLEAAKLTSQVQFVLDHRFLFESITGLSDAREALRMDVEGDFLDEHGQPGQYEVASFDKLPVRATSPVYRLCLEHGRPDFWAAFLKFEAESNDGTWAELRSKVIPWKAAYSKHSMTTVWQAAEVAAKARDGRDYGLMGRFRDGTVPSMFELLRAIKKA